MKNHILFKFIAVVLCAASLMGAVGSIAGVAVLSAGDLYNKTVDQVIEERIESNSIHYASELALTYASKALGGCSDSMVQAQLGSTYWFQNSYPNYGYAIVDAEGKVVSSYNAELKETASVYAVPVTGKYMYLVSKEAESAIQAREAEARITSYASGITDSDGTAVPANGIGIDEVLFLDSGGALVYEANSDSGSTYYYPDGNVQSFGYNNYPAGYLFYNQNNQLVYNSFVEDYGAELSATEVSEIYFVNNSEGFSFNMSDPNGLGTISNEEGKLVFVSSFRLESAVQETEPVTEPTAAEETTEATAESTAETEPEENDRPAPPRRHERESSEEYTETYAETYGEEYTEEYSAEESTEYSEEYSEEESTEYAEEYSEEEYEYTEEYREEASAEYDDAYADEEDSPVDPAAFQETIPEETAPQETVPETTEPILIEGKTLDNYQLNRVEYYDSELGETAVAKYVYLVMPELTVEMYVDRSTMQDAEAYNVLSLVRQYRNYLLPAIAICLMAFAILAVYLCTAAGRNPKSEEVRAGGLNRMPLDLYLFGGGFAIALIVAGGVRLAQELLRKDFMVGCGFAVGAAFLACLIFVGFCFAFVAQIKTPNGFWWRNSLCGLFVRLCIRFGRWLEVVLSTKVFPFLWELSKKLWKVTCKAAVWLFHAFEDALRWSGIKLGALFRWCAAKTHRFLSLLPLTWQWLVAGLAIIFILFVGVALEAVGFAVASILTMCIFLYASHCFGILSESTKRMSKGNLDTKVDDKLMIGCFKEFAGDLNDLADVAVVAAQKQLKSERMKTELITNVSHDIKTPLTSIINYVDLLQKPHTDEEEVQYLEVLDRQSQRLKKLIDDLMDMSKASTGNMTVEITKLDAVEAVNQALGEFADKLDKAQLIPVFRHDADSVAMMADGRLVWRVLSNLLSNAVKYAMPGTRMYIDLTQLEGKVVISMKNISRDELNVDAEELMERFVRGDDSRNTEGSGLGLNIAKSLMELQKGQLQLLVDGDLFKVTLIFPGA